MEYAEFFLNTRNINEAKERFGGFRFQNINDQWSIIYVKKTAVPFLTYSNYDYYAIPKLYGLMDQESMTDIGVTKVQNRANLNLNGTDILIGFVDTGIDYLHEAFRDESGQSRILSIWDQTIEGRAPDGFDYGVEFLADEINRAMKSENPYEIVPERDSLSGHGTFMAGIAAGSENKNRGFLGAAPNAQILMVKLRDAPGYLKDYYAIANDEVAYSESDIMLGIRYLIQQSRIHNLPMVICLGVGNSMGPHGNGSPLLQYVNQCAELPGIAIVAPMGNEGNERGHISGNLAAGSGRNIEIQVEEMEDLWIEVWGQSPAYFVLYVQAPSGERSPIIGSGRNGHIEISFVYEPTVIQVDFFLVETVSGNQLIALKFIRPTVGMWRLQIFNDSVQTGRFNMWLPIRQFMQGKVFFLNSDVELTITQPATANNVISVGTFNHHTGGLWIDSSRGYSVNGAVKPEIVAPGVEIIGPIPSVGVQSPHEQYQFRSGSSIATAHAAGVAALLMEWRRRQVKDSVFNTSDIKTLMILGAKRERILEYPNPEWGYGRLDVAGIFDTLAGID